MRKICLVAAFGLLAGGTCAQDASTSGAAGEVSVAAGERVSLIGGCHDCHSAGFGESNGIVDPSTALMGSPVGFQGPWGTTYAANLRVLAARLGEAEFVDHLKRLETRPPMPWFNLRHFTDAELASLHQYIRSLGDAGEPAPEYVPPGETPKTPYIVFVPQMPGS